MSQNVAEFVWKRLTEWGLSRVYGYPGDGVGGLDVALEKAKDFMDYVQVRHEEMAAFMASAHAKFTGQPGLCYATSGPGAIHLLTGLYDAKADHMPVVAIVGQQARSALGASYQQEVDLQNLFADVTEYVITAVVPEQVRTCIDRAVRIAQAKRAVTCVIIPNDLQELEYDDPPMAHGATHTGVGYPGAATLPDMDDLKKAAEILNKGKKVAMLVGAGALHATDEVIAVANRLNAGVAKALLGKAAVPDDLPFVTGSLGLLGTKPSWDLMKQCDTLPDGGISLSLQRVPAQAGQRARRPDRHRRRQRLAALSDGIFADRRQQADARRPPAAAGAERQRRLAQRRSRRMSRNGGRRSRSARWSRPIRSTRSASSTNSRRGCPIDVIMTGDSGSVANWYARDIKIRRGMMGSLSGGLASLGAATPYAVAAKMAYPDRPVIGFIGDGAMQMNGLNVMITVEQILAALVRSALHHHGAQQSRTSTR